MYKNQNSVFDFKVIITEKTPINSSKPVGKQIEWSIHNALYTSLLTC